MKEKNKKILKVLGVGTLACVGMFGLTGCANISNTDYSRIMESVETVENTVSDKEAAIVFNNAMLKIMNTSSDFWNNMKVQTIMTYTEDGEEYTNNIETYFFKTESNEQIYLQKWIGETDALTNNEYVAIYSENENVVYIDKEIDGYYKSEEEGSFVQVCYNQFVFSDLYVGMSTSEGVKLFESSDIVSAEKNENGNYVITIILNNHYDGDGLDSFVIDNEIDEGGNLLSQTVNVTSVYGEDVTTGSVVNTYSYGTLQYEDIQSDFEALQNYQG